MFARASILCLLLWLGTSSDVSAVGQSLFEVGNSLTWNSRPEASSATAAAWGQPLTIGYHIRGSSTLSEIYALEPTTVSEFGHFSEALTTLAWDNVMLQIHKSGGQTMAVDLTALDNFITLTRSNPANASTQFYIYGSWPWRVEFSKWENFVEDDLNTASVNQKTYYRHLAERTSDLIGERVYIVPVGEVLKHFDDEARAGNIPGLFSVNGIYEDHIHVNLLGSYLASTTVLATVLKQDPRGLPVPEEYWDHPTLTPERISKFQQIVWDVVANNPYTGVVGPRKGDVNGDGDVDQLDLAIWQEDLLNQPHLLADANGDLHVDSLDLQYWETALVPSPGELLANFNGDQAIDEVDQAIWLSSFQGSGELPADANGDGVVNAADYSIFRDAIGSLQSRLKADFNRDGKVDLLDRDVWEQQNGLFWELRADFSGNHVLDADDFYVWQENFFDFSQRLVGDYDQNGIVDEADRDVWEQTLGSRFLLNADGNDNGQIDQADYDLWLFYFNQSGAGNATHAVPEPASTVLGAIAAMGWLLRWRYRRTMRN